MHDEKNLDKDIEHIIDILQSIPQEDIPEHFELRLKNAIREEGKKIRESKGAIIKKQNKKCITKIAAAIAACFVVGFITLTMYNSGIGLPDEASDEISIASMESDGLSGGEYAPLYIDNNDMEESYQDDVTKRELFLEPSRVTDEYVEYERLIKQYLGNVDYEILSYNQKEETGEYVFNILITMDSEGNTVNTRMVLMGSEGEIYEPQQDKGEPISCY
jgi:hypothetical protein